MALLRLGGLASGLDTESLISQLLAAERGPRIRYEIRQQVVEARKSTLQDIQTKLKALQTAVADLRSPTLFDHTQTVESSDPTRVGVTRTGSAATGAYLVGVTQVAAAQQRSYDYTAPAADTTISAGGHDTVIAAGTSLTDAVAKINGDAGAKVWASEAEGKLVLSWRATGDATNADTVTSGALANETVLRAGRNAQYTIDGVAHSSQSNDVTTLPGLTLTIKAPTTSDVSINVGAPAPDAKRVTEKLKAFVDAYNAANDLMHAELREERVPNASNRVDRGKGVLRGDAGISALQAQLRIALSTTIDTGSTAADQLADLGVTTGATTGSSTFSSDSVKGRLVLDEAKLAATLAAEPSRAEQLLGGTGAGIAQKLDEVLNPILGTGGAFEERLKSADTEVTRLRNSMQAFDDRLELRERALRAMFTRLEQSLAQSQSQGNYLGQQLAQFSS